ncbi:uncharacterized protein LOC120344275 [Styela clava]
MNIRTLLVTLIVSVITVSGDETDTKKVWCVDDTVMQNTDLVKGIDRDDLCKSSIINATPWSDEEDKTPAKPENLQLQARTYKTDDENSSRQIAVFISWRQKMGDLPSSQSYYVELNFINPPGQHKQYTMTWDNALLRELENSTAHYVEFNFIYCSRIEGSYHIGPGDKYRFKIQGLPMYQEDSDPQLVAGNIAIPGCRKSKEIRRSAACRSHTRRKKRPKPIKPINEPAETIDKEEQPSTESAKNMNEAQNRSGDDPEIADFTSTNIVFIIVGAVIIGVLIMALLFILCRKRLHGYILPKKSVAKRRVLIISSLEEKYSQAINMLLKIFDKIESIKLTCNLRQKIDIGEHGIVKWVTKNVTDADIVVFVIGNKSEVAKDHCSENSPLEVEEIEKHQVGQSLNTAETIINSNKCVNSHKKFIVLDLHHHVKREDLPIFKHYRLLSDFKKFTHHVIGASHIMSTSDKKIFSNLLSNAQLGYGTKITTAEIDEDDVIDPKNAPISGQNNFDSLPFPPANIEEGQSLALNIDDTSAYVDGPPSCESNQSHEYVTTDYNNPGQSYRYLKAGARPKTKC